MGSPFGPWAGNGSKTTNSPVTGTATLTGTPSAATGDHARCAAELIRIHGWLEQAVLQAPDVNGLVPLVTKAVGCYRKGEHRQCLLLLNGLSQAITLARTAVPGLPAW